VEIVDEIVQLAKKLILEMGYHEPILFIRGTKKNLVVNFKEFGGTSDQRARRMLNTGANLAYKDNVGELESLVFVTEAWMGRASKKGEYIQPSLDPKRVEVLLINTLDTYSQEEQIICFEMVRNKEGKIIDLKQNTLPEGGSVEGILLPAFQKGYKAIRPTTN